MAVRYLLTIYLTLKKYQAMHKICCNRCHSCSLAYFQFIVAQCNDLVQLTRSGFEPGAGIDGTKRICLDEVYKDLTNKMCLIYSFGLSDDWAFEETMSHIGCKVTLINICDKQK